MTRKPSQRKTQRKRRPWLNIITPSKHENEIAAYVENVEALFAHYGLRGGRHVQENWSKLALALASDTVEGFLPKISTRPSEHHLKSGLREFELWLACKMAKFEGRSQRQAVRDSLPNWRRSEDGETWDEDALWVHSRKLMRRGLSARGVAVLELLASAPEDDDKPGSLPGTGSKPPVR